MRKALEIYFSFKYSTFPNTKNDVFLPFENVSNDLKFLIENQNFKQIKILDKNPKFQTINEARDRLLAKIDFVYYMRLFQLKSLQIGSK